MTVLGKGIVSAGIFILTLGALAWIILQNWQWMAAGTAIFFGSLLSAVVLSAETKQISKPPHNPPLKHFPPTPTPRPRKPQLSHPPATEWTNPPPPPIPPSQPLPPTTKKEDNQTQTFPTVSIPRVGPPNWEPPSSPPPDQRQEEDPFFSTPRHRQSPQE